VVAPVSQVQARRPIPAIISGVCRRNCSPKRAAAASASSAQIRPASTNAPRRLSKDSLKKSKPGELESITRARPSPRNAAQTGGRDVAHGVTAVLRFIARTLHIGRDRLDHTRQARVVAFEAEARPVVVLDTQPAAGAQRGGQPVEDLPALGEVLEHQAGMDQSNRASGSSSVRRSTRRTSTTSEASGSMNRVGTVNLSQPNWRM
jgi:hypothetical protein